MAALLMGPSKTVPEDEIQQQTGVQTVDTPALQVVEELVEADTGAEVPLELYSQRSKLYCFREGENQWEKGELGAAQLVIDTKTGKVEFMLRTGDHDEDLVQFLGRECECSNVPPYCELLPNADNEKAWVWSADDCSDGEPKRARLALKFASEELAMQFNAAFEFAKAWEWF